MKVIIRDSKSFSVNESGGVVLSLRTYKDVAQPDMTIGACSFGCGDDQNLFKFSPGAYDYEGWMDEVCDMVSYATQLSIARMGDDALCIVAISSDNRREARLLRNGECYVDDEVFHERKET